MFHLVPFYVASLLFWAALTLMWEKKGWFNMTIKMTSFIMMVWSLILVLQTFVPMKGQ